MGNIIKYSSLVLIAISLFSCNLDAKIVSKEGYEKEVIEINTKKFIQYENEKGIVEKVRIGKMNYYAIGNDFTHDIFVINYTLDSLKKIQIEQELNIK